MGPHERGFFKGGKKKKGGKESPPSLSHVCSGRKGGSGTPARTRPRRLLISLGRRKEKGKREDRPSSPTPEKGEKSVGTPSFGLKGGDRFYRVSVSLRSRGGGRGKEGRSPLNDLYSGKKGEGGGRGRQLAPPGKSLLHLCVSSRREEGKKKRGARLYQKGGKKKGASHSFMTTAGPLPFHQGVPPGGRGSRPVLWPFENYRGDPFPSSKKGRKKGLCLLF